MHEVRADVALDLEFLTNDGRANTRCVDLTNGMVAADFLWTQHRRWIVCANGLHCRCLKMFDRNRFLWSCGRRKSMAGFHLKFDSELLITVEIGNNSNKLSKTRKTFGRYFFHFSEHPNETCIKTSNQKFIVYKNLASETHGLSAGNHFVISSLLSLTHTAVHLRA